MSFYYDIVNWLYSDINKKKSVTKGHMLHDPIYMKCPEKANPKREKVD